MSRSLNRNLAELIDGTGSAVAGGLTVYATKENLPSTGLTSGDQAYVTNTSRFYISNGSGWYNVALVNANPALTISPSGTIQLNNEGSATTITLTGTDSDNAVAGLTFSVESDGDFFKMATLSQDSSVFTITPRSQDSFNTLASDGTATLTFKASDGVSFGTGTSALTLTFTIQYSQYTTMLLKADASKSDAQTDLSSNSSTIGEVNQVYSYSYSPYHPGGYSTYFDGTSNSQILIQGESTLAVGTGNFSCSVWYKSDGTLDHRVIASSVATTATTQLYWNMSVRSDGALWLQTRSSANNGLQYWGKSATGLITSNTWHHLVVARIGGVHYCAVDGVVDTTVDQDTATMNITSQEIAVGASNITAYQSYNKGYMRDFNFCVGGVEYDLSSGNFAVPDEPISAHSNTKVLIANKPYIKDTSATPLTIDTIGSAIKTVRDGPYDYFTYDRTTHGGSVYLYGTDDYFTVDGGYLTTNTTWWNSSGFTLETWLYKVSTNDEHTIWDNRQSGNANGFLFRIRSGGLYMYSNNAERATNLGANIVNQWQHVALVCSGTTGKIFQNGVQVGSDFTVPDTASHTYFGRTQNTIGAIQYQPRGAGTEYLGYMSDFRISSGSRYTGTFTPTTEAFANDGTTVFLTFKNQNNIWDTGLHLTPLVKQGNVTASNTQRKFATSSAVVFDGNDDRLEFSADVANFGTGDFTIEMWMYPTEYGNGLFNKTTETGASSPPSVSVYMTSSAFLIGVNSGSATGSWDTASSVAALNQWSHFAMTREGTSLKAFLNGTSILSTTNSANVDNNITFNLGKWRNSTEHFNGYMQDVRLTKGLARYTANFTPSTATFEG